MYRLPVRLDGDESVDFALIRNLSFELPEDPPLIEKKSQIVTRPAIRQADGKYKNSMPLRVKVVRSD